jgi:hypothetical protein
MSRTPYSPLVENETAPLPWNAGLEETGVGSVSGRSLIPSDFVGIECRAKPETGSTTHFSADPR